MFMLRNFCAFRSRRGRFAYRNHGPKASARAPDKLPDSHRIVFAPWQIHIQDQRHGLKLGACPRQSSLQSLLLERDDKSKHSRNIAVTHSAAVPGGE